MPSTGDETLDKEEELHIAIASHTNSGRREMGESECLGFHSGQSSSVPNHLVFSHPLIRAEKEEHTVCLTLLALVNLNLWF